MHNLLENRANALMFFIVFLAVIFLGIAGFYFISYTYESKNRKELETQLALVESQKNKLQEQIEEATREKLALEEKNKENEKLIPELQEKLKIETQAKELLMDEHESLQNEIVQLEQDKKDIKIALNVKSQEVIHLQTRLNALILERDELRAKIINASPAGASSKASKGEDLEKIVVKSSSFQHTKPPLSTEVLLVNKTYGFVVLDAGKPEGIELKDIFEIMHKNTSLGFVRVEKIHDTISAADFLEGFNKDKVSEGDQANRVN